MGELAPGTMVTSNVRLVELIARGGMGSVWTADHLGLETRVAVKFIKPEIASRDPSVGERFRREASIAAQIRSIHVVQVFDHGVTQDGTPYIVMELLEGRSVTDRIERDGPMTLREVGMVVGQVAKVLHRAHVLGIVHRDIKPDNIFLIDSDYELFVKVLDFGIAKQTRSMARGGVTKTGVVVGTPEFMSPEQAVSSKHIDHRTDIYSLAVVAYYMLTRQLPFDPDAPEPIWMQMASGRFPPPSRYVGRLPVALDGWFRRAMHPKPEGRFESVKVMADVLAQIVGPDMGESIEELSTSMGPASRARMADELSSISGEGNDVPISSGPSEPAKYDLFGPDSEAFGMQGTLLMDVEDHNYAEAKGEQPVGALDKPSGERLPASTDDAAPTPRLHRFEDARFKTEPSGIQPLPAVDRSGVQPLPELPSSPGDHAPPPAPSPGPELPAWLSQASSMSPNRTLESGSGPRPLEPDLEALVRAEAKERRVVYAIGAVFAVVVLAVIVTLVI